MIKLIHNHFIIMIDEQSKNLQTFSGISRLSFIPDQLLQSHALSLQTLLLHFDLVELQLHVFQGHYLDLSKIKIFKNHHFFILKIKS